MAERASSARRAPHLCLQSFSRRPGLVASFLTEAPDDPKNLLRHPHGDLGEALSVRQPRPAPLGLSNHRLPLAKGCGSRFACSNGVQWELGGGPTGLKAGLEEVAKGGSFVQVRLVPRRFQRQRCPWEAQGRLDRRRNP